MVRTARRKRSNSRLEPLLAAAAELYAAHGYHATTIRDIARSVDMLPGSVYYHFESKEQLLVAVYEEGVRNLCERVDRAVNATDPPWTRLEAALIAHLDALLDQSASAQVLVSVSPDTVPDVRDALEALRDQYETRWRGLIDALPLPAGTDRKLLRLMLLGSANWSQVWYRPGEQTPTDIARGYLQFLKTALAGPEVAK